MAVYAIGDVQGCYPELTRLLETLQFDPAVDKLWFCGDLVNRGGESLQTLRLIKSLGDAVTITLGNHDLSLLAIHERPEDAKRRVNPELQEVLFATDAAELMHWLRQQNLLHYDETLNYLMVHAGISPNWSLAQARRIAGEAEQELRGPHYQQMLKQMFGNYPNYWAQRLRGVERTRATLNILTRMRYVDIRARIQFDAKGRPGTQKPGQYPWFAMPGVRQRQTRIVFGHWSTLGLFAGLGVYALDTGCVWGGKLTAMRLDTPQPSYIQVDAESHRQPPSQTKPRAPRRGRRRRARHDHPAHSQST